MWNLPNTLTLCALRLIPVFIAIYYTSWEWHNLIAAAVFGAGGSHRLGRRLSGAQI